MSKVKNEWWFSADESRGFNWAAVVGYDFKAAGRTGYSTSVLYVYTSSGIIHIVGVEAEKLAEEMKGRFKQL